MLKIFKSFLNLFKREDPIETTIRKVKESADAVVLDEHGNLDPDQHLSDVLNAVLKTGGPVYGTVDKKGKLHLQLPKKSKVRKEKNNVIKKERKGDSK